MPCFMQVATGNGPDIVLGLSRLLQDLTLRRKRSRFRRAPPPIEHGKCIMGPHTRSVPLGSIVGPHHSVQGPCHECIISHRMTAQLPPELLILTDAMCCSQDDQWRFGNARACPARGRIKDFAIITTARASSSSSWSSSRCQAHRAADRPWQPLSRFGPLWRAGEVSPRPALVCQTVPGC